MQRPTATGTTHVQRGRPWPKGVSGNSSGSRVSKRVVTLFSDMVTDFGGEAALLAVDRALLMQACRLMVRAERVKDADAAVRLSSEARRGLGALRRRVAAAPRDEPMASEVLRARYSRLRSGEPGP
jgi:hypothetical protein